MYTIPYNKNLTNTKIDSHLKTLNDVIINAIERSVPIFHNSDQLKKFASPIVKKRAKYKIQVLKDSIDYNIYIHSEI